MNQKQAAWYALAVLFVINALNFFDRQIIGAVGESIRKEFGLSDSALGALNTAFTLLYAFVGLPLGKLADKYSRKKILAIGVFIWSLMTAASGLAQNFWQIFAMRLGVGVGEATCAPAASSVIGDYFPSDKRAKAMAFFIAGLPGLLCVLAVFFIKEPARGAVEMKSVGTRKRDGSPIKLILATPTMVWLILSGAVHNFIMYAHGGFITPYMMRHHNLDIAHANYVVAIIYGLLTAPGLLLGGFVGDWAKRKRADGALLIATFAILLSIPFFFFSIGIAAGEYATFAVLIGASIALMYFYYSIVYATIADVTEPASRGTAMAVYFLAMYLLGASLGPYILGLISEHFTTQAAIAAGITELTAKTLEPFRGAGLRSAMYVVPVLSVALMLILFAASRTVKKDIEKIQNWMKGDYEPENEY